MDYAIDLNPRQSARTLEQAVRYQGTVLLEPGTWPETEGLKGRLAALEPDTVRVELTEPTVLTPANLVGSYCDVTLELGRDRFLFSTHAAGAEQCGAHWYVDLARPAKLQVCQRRRFWRVNLAESSQVQLHWTDNGVGREVVGWVCNISGEGLACLVQAEAAGNLFIGETISVSFQLPGCSERFTLDAVLCNKTPNAREDKIIVGMQFLEPASSGAAGPAHRLNEFLVRRFGAGVGSVSSSRMTDGAVS